MPSSLHMQSLTVRIASLSMPVFNCNYAGVEEESGTAGGTTVYPKSYILPMRGDENPGDLERRDVSQEF